MLRITVELVPHGDEKDKSVLSQIEIANTGKKNSNQEYQYVFYGWFKAMGGDKKNIRKGSLPFDRSKSIVFLLNKLFEKIAKLDIDKNANL